MLQELRKYSNKIHIKKGKMIYQAGDMISSVYFLEQGFVKLARDGADGHSVTIAILEKGEVFGFLDRLNYHLEHTEDSVALSDCVLLSFPIQVVLNHLENLPVIERTLLESFVRQFDQAKEVIYVHSKMTVPERISWFLRKMANVENGVPTINFPLTHEEISYMVGCSRQKVTMYLSKWKKEGTIYYDRDCIKLVDIDHLG